MITSIFLWLALIVLGWLLVYCGNENSIECFIVFGVVILVIVLLWGLVAVGNLGDTLEKSKYTNSSTNQLTNAVSPVK